MIYDTIINTIINTTNKIIENILLALPGLFFALIIILVGWIIAKIIRAIFKRILVKVLKLDKWLAKNKLDDALGDMKLSNILSGLVYWWVMVLFIGQAFFQLNLGVVSDILQRFIIWTPNLLYAVLLLVGGFYFADFVTDKIKKSKNKWADRTALILEPGIVFFVALIAFSQLGFNVRIILDIVRILIIAIAAGIALAIGLAFGLGMKDETPKMWKSMTKEFNKQR